MVKSVGTLSSRRRLAGYTNTTDPVVALGVFEQVRSEASRSSGVNMAFVPFSRPSVLLSIDTTA